MLFLLGCYFLFLTITWSRSILIHLLIFFSQLYHSCFMDCQYVQVVSFDFSCYFFQFPCLSHCSYIPASIVFGVAMLLNEVFGILGSFVSMLHVFISIPHESNFLNFVPLTGILDLSWVSFCSCHSFLWGQSCWPHLPTFLVVSNDMLGREERLNSLLPRHKSRPRVQFLQ